MDVIVDNQYSQISLVGSDKDKFKEGKNPNIDMFILREGDSRQATNYLQLVALQKSNSVQYIDYINTPILKSRKVMKMY